MKLKKPGQKGTYPTKLTLYIFLFPFIFIFLGLLNKTFIYIGLSFNLVIVILIFFDIFISPNVKRLTVEIVFKNNLNINSYNDFEVLVENKNSLPISFYFLLDLDNSFNRDYSKILINLPPNSKQKVNLKIFTLRRGEFTVKRYYLKGLSFLKLLHFYSENNYSVAFNVVPYTNNFNKYIKLLQKDIKKFQGVQKTSIIGDNNNFYSLKEYSTDDEFNKIDWKATSRVNKVISRVYKLENNLEIALLLDCGRLMSSEVKGLSLLDYAVNSSLVLAHSVLKSGDKISITCFNNDIIKHLPSTKNKKDINKIKFLLTNIDFKFVESNYQNVFYFIKQKLHKRSLIILLTDIIDDSNINIYKKYIKLFLKNHMMLLILVRDKNLFYYSNLQSTNSVYIKTAAADLILRRDKTIFSLKNLGIEILDLYPEEITPELINKYISIKNRN